MDSIPMTCVGGDDLASSAATPAMHLDRTFKPPLAEAIPQASLRAYPSSSSNAASSPPLFLVFCKGMASDEVVGPPGPSGVVVAVLAAAVCGPQGDVLLTVRKPVVGFVGGPDGAALLEAAALVEGLHAAHGLGIRSVKVITDHKMLHDLMLRICSPTGEKLADMMDQAVSVQKKFEQFEISLVQQSQASCVVKLARYALSVEIAKSRAVSDKNKEKTLESAAERNGNKERRETCSICLEDTGVSKIHAVEGCGHRFCFSCMKEHVRFKLLYGMLPACPRIGCTTMLTVEGSKALVPPPLLETMAQRIRERQIPEGDRIYCPYPKCSALMSLSEVQGSCSSKYNHGGRTCKDAALRKCVRCGGSLCIRCKVPWHERMSCREYQWLYPHGGREDAELQKLAKQRLWRQCGRCKHMIELSMGCSHVTCKCRYEFCYKCGREWMKDQSSCYCDAVEEGRTRGRGWCLPLPACWGRTRR